MAEKGVDTPRDMTPLREGYTLVNEGDIEHFLEGDPTLFETLLEVRKVGGSYFPHASFSVGVESFYHDDSQHLLVMIDITGMDRDEANLRLDRLYSEWYFDHVSGGIVVTICWDVDEELPQENEEDMYANPT